MSQRQVLIVVIGGGADVLPMIAFGRALVTRGHRVRLLSSPYFASRVRSAGLAFHPCVSHEPEGVAIHDPSLWKAGRGYRALFDGLLNAVPETYRAIAMHHMAGRTVVVANAAAMAARIARETLGAPLVTVHLQPIMLRSRNHQPGLMVSRRWTPLIRAFRSVLMPAVDHGVFDPLLTPGLNKFRARMGLAPVRRVFAEWIHSPDLVLGMFPEWFAQPEPDWPAPTRLSGFPPPLQCEHSPSAHAELEAFLQSGPPPIAFWFGTPIEFAGPFLKAAVEMCRASRRRGLLFTAASEHLPALADVRYFNHPPCVGLLKRTGGLVHHGSIDAMAAAFAAGIPQIAVPLNFDQPDNAARLRALGAGAVIRPSMYSAEALAATLDQLLSSPAVLEKSRSLSAQMRASDPMDVACDALEAVADLTLGRGAGTRVS